MANEIKVAQLFVRAAISDDLTVAKVKEAAVKNPNKLYMCSTGEIFAGDNQYSVNQADYEAIKAAVADIVASGKTVGEAIKDAIDALDVAAIGGTGKVITTVSQTDGKIAATAIDLKAANVAATAVAAGDDTVAVDGATVEAQVASLGKAIKTVEKAAAKYTVKKITTGLDANVKEAYQLVQTIDGTSTDIDVQIPIYKDQTLKEVVLTDADEAGTKGQFMKYTYTLADGSDSVVYVDVSQFLVESEFKNGLVVNSGEVSVKIDDASEKFLSLSEAGVKVSGVADAIAAAVKVETDRATAAETANKTAIETEVTDRKKAITDLVDGADDDYNTLKKLEDKIKTASTVVNEKTDGHVTVAVTKGTDGNSVVTVSENDIASAKDTASSLNNLLEIVGTLYNGQKDSVATAADIKNNLNALLTELSDPATYWEDYTA